MQKKERPSSIKPSRPWQARWWREDVERGRWAATIAIIFVLMGAFAFQNPLLWQDNPSRGPAKQDSSLKSAETAPSLAATPKSGLIEAGHNIPEPPETTQEPAQGLISTEQSPADSVTTASGATDSGASASGATDSVATASGATISGGATLQPEGDDPENREPDGSERQNLEQAIIAVSVAPASWLPPGFGEWSRSYGYGLDPTYGDYRFHGGQDMSLNVGAPVFAAAEGLVKLAAEDTVWGGIVIIEHGGGWSSVYKCLQPTVKPGDRLTAGEQIGLVLSPPAAEKAQDSHLHFEMLLNGERQNPSQWL